MGKKAKKVKGVFLTDKKGVNKLVLMNALIFVF